MERITRKDLDAMFGRYVRAIEAGGYVRDGYHLTLDIGSKTYGRAYRVYETANRELWGTDNGKGGKYGSGQYEPTIGRNYLGMTAREAYDALADRAGLLEDVAYAAQMKDGEGNRYRCTGCGQRDDNHPFAACEGAAFMKDGE